MKIWYHIMAAVVGFAIAALIVYNVFGSADDGVIPSEGAGALGAAESLCGTVAPAQANSPETRTLAGKNLPVLANEIGPIPSIDTTKIDQVAWFARVHAASGLCLDEIKVDTDAMVTLTMSTIDSVTDAEAGAFAAGAIAQAFSPPLNRPKVTLFATVDGSERTAVISKRAWTAFQIAREARNRPLTMTSLAQFKQATAFGPADLRVVGWR